jgi:hypothetical protein
MHTAIDLYRAGLPVSADEMDHLRAAAMRLACPECLERVHFVRRQLHPYFAHHPWENGSPACALRVDSGGAGSGSASTPEPLPPNTSFQDAFRKAFGLNESPPRPSEEIDRAVRRIHEVWLKEKRTVTVADFFDALPDLREAWTTDEAWIRNFLEDGPYLLGILREDFRNHPGCHNPDHRRTVLLLWRHLHHPPMDDDLRFLLRVARRVTSPISTAHLVANSLGILARIPWSDLSQPSREETCELCRRSFEVLPNGQAAACSECNAVLCADCLTFCSRCHDALCERCLDACPVCHEAVCSTCSHFDWECGYCGKGFCEGGWEEPQETSEKNECGSCGEAFCDDCASEVLEEGEEGMLCESCREDGL